MTKLLCVCLAASLLVGSSSAAFGQSTPFFRSSINPAGAKAASDEPASVFTSKPTPALLKELEKQLAGTPPSSTFAKLSRIELAARMIQVDLLLGDEGTGLYDEIGIEPAEAQAALAALRKTPLHTLNDLESKATRQLLWDALGAAHPLYRLYSQGARLAGHRDDPRVLDRTLRLIKESWAAGAGSNKPDRTLDVVEEWMRDVLLELLRYQSVSGAAEAEEILQAQVSPERQPFVAPRTGDPAPRVPKSIVALRTGSRLTEFDKLAHLAAALQRAGYDVTFWNLALFVSVDDSTKTISNEPLILFAEENGGPKQIAIGPEAVLALLGGEQLGEQIYRFTDRERLQALLTERGQFVVPMKEVLEATSSPTAWSRALQESLARTKGELVFRRILLELAQPDPWAAFAKRASASLHEQPRERFREQMRRNQAQVTLNLVQANGKIQPREVANFAELAAEDSLPKHEAAMGWAFQMLPEKMSPGLKQVTLQSKALPELRDFAVIEGGKVIVKKVEKMLGGRGWAHRVYLASGACQDAVHENLHAWAYARTERLQLAGWRGTAVDPFFEISWREDRETRKWALRNKTYDRDDFFWEYGATSEHEDLAVMGQYYVCFPRYFREQARAQLKQGNLVPAVKYLYLKHVAFLDDDGLCVEYGIDQAETPLSIQELQQQVRLLERGGGLSAEQDRLWQLALLGYELSRQLVEGGKIVRAE